METFMRDNTVIGTVSELGHWSPLSILESYGDLWPPRDIRYLAEGYTSEDNENLTILALSMQIHLIKKIPEANAIDFGLYIVGDLKKHKYYYENKDIDPNDTTTIQMINPVTGDTISVKPEDNSEEKNKMSLCARIRYALKFKGNNFELSFAAWDSKNRLLYYNVIEKPDMTSIMKQATQELFGNHKITGDSGSFLEGIPMLLNGNKVKSCTLNPEPESFVLARPKTFNPEKIANKGAIYLFNILFVIFGILVPIVITFKGIIPSLLAVFTESTDSGFSSPDMFKILFWLVLTVVSFYLGDYFQLKSNQLKFYSNII